jgi:hypothetical protein
MARRKDETTEAPATDSTTESTTTEATEAPAKAEVTFDLTEFQTAATEAVEASDKSTGTVPEDALGKARSAFQALPSVSAKNAAKKLLNEGMRKAMEADDIASARAYVALQDGVTVKPPKADKEPKAPADPTEGFVSKVAAISLAYNLATTSVPEGVAEDWATKVQEQVAAGLAEVTALNAHEANEAEDKGEAPELGYVARTAVRVASGKAPGAKSGGSHTPFAGTRRDVGAHILSAFDGAEVGTFLTVAEIRSHKSAEYGDDAPSAGAISARLFPTSGKTTVVGIEPGQNDKGVRGALKVAVEA